MTVTPTQQIAIDDPMLKELIVNYEVAKLAGLPAEDIASAYFVLAYEIGYNAGLAAAKQQVTFVVRDDDATEEAS